MTFFGPIANLLLALALLGAAAPAAPPVPPPAVAPAAPTGLAQAPKGEILGVWKGSSVCTQVEGNEFCHDETVVYNFVDVPARPDAVTLKAARIVNDRLVPMYELYFTYRTEKGEWSCEFERPSFRGLWSYVVRGDAMTGTATLLPSLKVVRNVTASRVPKDEAIAH